MAMKYLRKTLSENRWLVWVFLPLSLMFVVALAFVVGAIFSASLGSNMEGLGQTGDFFGGFLNPLITFASFTVLICALFVQIGELREATISREKLTEATDRQTDASLKSKSVDNAVEVANSLEGQEGMILRSNLRKTEPVMTV